MARYRKHPFLAGCIGLFLLHGGQVRADTAKGVFVDLSLGAAAAHFQDIGQAAVSSSDQSGFAVKLGAGYWLSPKWGIFVRGLRSASIERKYEAGPYEARVESIGVGTQYRFFTAKRLSGVVKLALERVRTDVRESPGGTAFERLDGGSTNLLVGGLELDYALNDSVELFMEIEGNRDLGKRLEASYSGIGLRVSL